MGSEKVELSENAASYTIEVDVRDLSIHESLGSRYARYSGIASPSTPSENDRNVATTETQEAVIAGS